MNIWCEMSALATKIKWHWIMKQKSIGIKVPSNNFSKFLKHFPTWNICSDSVCDGDCVFVCDCVYVWGWHVMSNDYVDHWDMLNNFCFHVYAQKWHEVLSVKCLCWYLEHSVKCQMLMLILGTYWTTFVFMSMLRSHCL